MAERNEGKEDTQGASLASKNGGTPSRDAATTESGRLNEDRSGTLEQDPLAGENRKPVGGGKASAQQGEGGPRQSDTRSGMTGGQLGDADANEGEDQNEASRKKSLQANDMSGVAGGYQDPADNNGKQGTGQTSAQAGDGNQRGIKGGPK